MPRHRGAGSPRVVYRTARAGLRLTGAQRRRLLGLLASAGDVWACVLEINAWRRARQDRPLASYQELCRMLAASGPGTFGELDSVGARSVLRRCSDAWFAAAKRRNAGDPTARFPRRRRRLVPVRWYAGTFTLEGRRLRIPVAKGCPPLMVRLDRALPCPAGQVRSVTVLYDAGWLWADITAEVPVATYPQGAAPDPGQVAGWMWGSFTRMRRPGLAGGPCWCRGGRSVPNATSTCGTPRPAAGRWPAGPPRPGSAGLGGGACTGAAKRWWRRGTAAGFARPSTKPPAR